MNILFCVPGRGFSSVFLQRWTLTLLGLERDGHNCKLAAGESSDLPYLRNKLAGYNARGGRYQLPHALQKDANYDVQIWIDSDQVWLRQDVERLIDLLEQGADIACGLYRTTDLDFPVFVTKEDATKDIRMTAERLESMGEAPFPIFACGMGFVGIRRETLQKIECPWFTPLPTMVEGLIASDSEDVSFFRRAHEAGLSVILDPLLRIGHEKAVII